MRGKILPREKSEKALKLSEEKITQTLKGLILAMEHTIEQRDPYTTGHQRKVAHLAEMIAEEMGLEEEMKQGRG